MPILLALTTIPKNSPSAWVDTDGVSNIAIGIVGKGARIQFNLGGTTVYDVSPQNINNDGAIISKANQVRVYNTTGKEISYEVFS